MSWCVMQLRKTTLQHVCVFDSVTVLFIPLWKLSITHRFDIRLVSYANAYFICILTIAVLNGRQLPTVLRRIWYALVGQWWGNIIWKSRENRLTRMPAISASTYFTLKRRWVLYWRFSAIILPCRFFKTIPVCFWYKVIVKEHVWRLCWMIMLWLLMKCDGDCCVWNSVCVRIIYSNNCYSVLIALLTRVYDCYIVSQCHHSMQRTCCATGCYNSNTNCDVKILWSSVVSMI